MERDTSRESFGFTMDVLGSTRRPTTVIKLVVTALQHIMTPSLVTLDIFALGLFQIQMRTSLPFLLAKDLRRFLLIMRTRSFLLSYT